MITEKQLIYIKRMDNITDLTLIFYTKKKETTQKTQIKLEKN